jgi:hypothetical protein
MTTPIDYTKLAASLDYAVLNRKLTQLAERQPTRKRKTVADVLEPLRERLLALHAKGWTSGDLAEELKAAGVSVNPSRLRECLSRWIEGDGATARKHARRRPTRAASNVQPTSPLRHDERRIDGQTPVSLPKR